MHILELSYKHLPDHLKPCFLYFGKFEEDGDISAGKLKRLWVADGFIRKEKNKNAENIAGEYLMELIDKSLVMIAKRRVDGRGAKSCVLRDLLRELCLRKSKEERFLKYWNNNYGQNIYGKGHIRAGECSASWSYSQHVRSFVGDRQSSFYVRDMRSLRVLHFNTIYICSRTFGIEYLVSLRFLVIQNLPTWIDKLVNLEYLCVDLKWGKTVYLPPTIVKMKRLRYHSAEPANFRKDWKMKKLRNDCASYAKYSEDWNISNQTNNLEYLSQIAIKTVRDEELLKCSPHLRKLRCIYNQEGIGKREYPHFDLHFLTQLHTLFIKFSPHFYLRVAELVKFRFPTNIRKLTLCSSWLPWKKMSIIGRLEFLEVLKLYEDAFVGEIWDTRDGEFQKLRYLQLDGLSYLSQWNVASNEHFPELQQLILIGCDNLAEIPSEIGEITTLELIEVRGYCLSSLVESAERIKEEQWDAGNDELKVIISDARPYVSGAPDEDEACDTEISDEDEASDIEISDEDEA